MKNLYKRACYNTLFDRLSGELSTIQVITGPRQVGKTTLVKQVLDELKLPSHYASADGPTINSEAWIIQQWDIAKIYAADKGNISQRAILVLDEVQKIKHWSEIIKNLWDRQAMNGACLKVVLLGSSPLLLRKGLDESLAGRFELLQLTHWSFQEMQDAYGYSLEQYIYFGGYPRSAEFIHDEERWREYILNSLIETTISRDILLTSRIDKPILLRRLFELCCAYSGQILSYNKMIGQLDNAGNTTTLAHYLELLAGIGMVGGLEKFSGSLLRQKNSSPKLSVFNTAIISVQQFKTFSQAQLDRDFWGRLAEAAVGAYLANASISRRIKVMYWRNKGIEVDYVLSRGKDIVALEVKSGLNKAGTAGMAAFDKLYRPKRMLLVGGAGIPLEKFLSTDIDAWFD